jgi:protein-L-isoaspartate(D-aspartate) O-methyltransferase
LIAELERREVILSERVRRAFLAVPRERFVPELAAREGLTAVYRDEAIVTKHDEHGHPLSSSSQPAIMALMLEQLDLDEGMRVLEVGAGTGYNAALLSLLVGRRGRVVTVDVDAVLAAAARRTLRESGYRVRVAHADGRVGFPATAPYDRIIVTASSDGVPHAWFEQLTRDGLLEVPLRLDATGAQAIPVLRKTPLGFRSLSVVGGGFMPLRAPSDERWDPPREPCLVVSDLRRDGPRPLVHLSGTALDALSAAAKRRLVATALGEPRRRRLGLRADHCALGLYLSLTLPQGRRVTSIPTFRVGAVGRDGRSLALIEARPRRPEVDLIMSYGGDEAETFLRERVREWADRGRPTASDLRITVTYARDRSRLTVGWPRPSHTPRP